MKVILLSELKGKGGEGDVIDVATALLITTYSLRELLLLLLRAT